jgi:hypothetical protein
MPKTPEEIAAEAAEVMEKIRGLGFDTFDAYAADQKARLEKKEAQLADKQSFIDVQGSEIGTLRGENTSLTELIKKQGETTSPADTQGGQPDTGDGLDGLDAQALERKLTPEARKKSVEMLEGLSEEDQQVATSTPDAQAAFLRHVLRTQQTAPVSFIDRLKGAEPQPAQDLEKTIQGLFTAAAKPAISPTSNPVGIPGVARTKKELEAIQAAAVETSRSNPIIMGGDLSGSLAAHRANAGT